MNRLAYGLAAAAAALGTLGLVGAPAEAASQALAAQATTTLTSTFSELGQAPAAAPASRAGSRVLSYLDPSTARIVDAQGRRALLFSSAPLLGRNAQGAQQPVDLALRPDGAGRVAPVSSAVETSIATDPTGGFAVGPDSARAVDITPVDADPAAAATTVSGQLLFAGAHPDSDLLIRPQADGVETFEQLRSAAAPERFGYHLGLQHGQVAGLEDGAAKVTAADGSVVLTVAPPVALDADRNPVPTHLELDGDQLEVVANHRTGNFRYPVIVDPDWSSTYDYAGHPGLGLQGWNVDYGPPGAVPYYDAFVNNQTDPATDPNGEALGFFIRPRIGAAGSRAFPVGAYGRLAFNAPGTTHIRSVAFSNVSRFNDRDRQTLRLGLYGQGFADIDDVFDAQVLSENPVVLPRQPFAPNADTPATSAVIWMFTAPCDPASDDNCPPTLRSGTRSLLRVGTVDLELTDFDNPSTALGGSLGDIAGRWTNITDDRTLAVSAQDPGSGIDHLDLYADNGNGRSSVFSRQADCHPDHDQVDPPQGNTICPATLSTPDGAPLTIRTGGLGEGRTTFSAVAGDYAGNSSDSGSSSAATSVYLDRRRPATTVDGDLADVDSGYVIAQRPATVRVTGQDTAGGQGRNSGIASIQLTGRDQSGAIVYDRTASTCDTAAADGEHPCEPGRSATFTVDLRRLPEERIDFTASSADLAGNRSEERRFAAQLDRTPPAARALGDLVDLQDRYTNREGQVQVELQGRDAASGVRDLLLVARNADGDQILKTERVCTQSDIDQTGACPHLASRKVTVDAGELPDGRTSFVARAVDLAGLQSVDGTDWNNYVDHTPPAAPDQVTVDGVSTDTVQISWPAVTDQPQGAGQVSYEYLVVVNGEPVGGWRPTNDTSTQVGGLPPGVTVQTLVRAIDSAQNVGRPTAGAGVTRNLLLAGPSAGTSSSASNASLAQRFRPILRFDSSETFRPLNVDEFIRHTDLRICPSQAAKDHDQCLAVDHQSSAFNQLRTGAAQLDQVGVKRTNVNGHHTDQARCYQHGQSDCFDGEQGGWYYQKPDSPSPVPYEFFNYWAFYRYNDAPYGGVSELIQQRLRHEGDWEGLTVAVPRGSDPRSFSFVGFTAHGKLWRYLTKALRCGGGASGCSPSNPRVVDYVAHGTHANYPFECRARTRITCNQTDNSSDGRRGLPDNGHDGHDAWSLNDSSRNLARLPNASQSPWVAWPGNWNEDSSPTIWSPAAPRSGPGTDNYQRYAAPWTLAQSTPRLDEDSPRAAPRADVLAVPDPCATWNGPGVAASLCEPARLQQALDRGTLEAPTSAALQSDGRSDAGGDGIVQLAGDPLRPGQQVRIGGSSDADVQLRARTVDPATGTQTDVLFSGAGGRLQAGGNLQVAMSAGQVQATVRTPTGASIAPTVTGRRTGAPAPRVRRVALTRRRIALTVTATAPTAQLEVARSCTGPALATRTVKLASGKAKRVGLPRRGTIGRRVIRASAQGAQASSPVICKRVR